MVEKGVEITDNASMQIHVLTFSLAKLHEQMKVRTNEG